MALSSVTARLAALQLEVKQQRNLIQQQIAQIEKQQAILDVQFRRIADIQAELDLVKATVRLAAPEHAAKLMGPTQPMRRATDLPATA
jgi:hypothetical protein